MPANYRKFVVDIGTVQDRKEVLGPGTALEAVTVVRCPAGADVSLHIGQQGDGIPVSEGDNFSELCGEVTGLYLTIGTASPGDTVTLAAFFSSGNLTRGV